MLHVASCHSILVGRGRFCCPLIWGFGIAWCVTLGERIADLDQRLAEALRKIDALAARKAERLQLTASLPCSSVMCLTSRRPSIESTIGAAWSDAEMHAQRMRPSHSSLQTAVATNGLASVGTWFVNPR